MPMSPRDVETALIKKLSADATLAQYMPNGVFLDVAPEGATRFVIVSVSTSRAQWELDDGETLRELVMLVKAVAQDSDASDIGPADERIEALLNHGTLDLSAAGCELMAMRWRDRVRYSEYDANKKIWQHAGARYELTVTPT